MTPKTGKFGWNGLSSKTKKINFIAMEKGKNYSTKQHLTSLEDAMIEAKRYVDEYGELPKVQSWKRRDIAKQYPWFAKILGNAHLLGGMKVVRKRLGINPDAQYIWTAEAIEEAARAYLKEHKEFPNVKEARKTDWYLAVGRGNYPGGVKALRTKLGLPPNRPRDRFRHTKESVTSDCLAIIDKLGYLPPSLKENERKYPCLKYLSQVYPGGRWQFEIDYDLNSIQRKSGTTQNYIENPDLINEDFDKLHKKYSYVPRTVELTKANDCLIRAIRELYGDYNEYLLARGIEPINYQEENRRYKTKEDVINAYYELYSEKGRVLNRVEIGEANATLYKTIIRYWGGLQNFHADQNYEKLKYVADDGHVCDSHNELLFDNILYANDIEHERNQVVEVNGYNYIPDFIVNGILVEVLMIEKLRSRNTVVLDTYKKKSERKIRDYESASLDYRLIYADDLEDKNFIKNLLSSISPHCQYPRVEKFMLRKSTERFYSKDEIIEKLKEIAVDGEMPTGVQIRKDYRWGATFLNKMREYFKNEHTLGYVAAAQAAGLKLPKRGPINNET